MVSISRKLGEGPEFPRKLYRFRGTQQGGGAVSVGWFHQGSPMAPVGEREGSRKRAKFLCGQELRGTFAPAKTGCVGPALLKAVNPVCVMMVATVYEPGVRKGRKTGWPRGVKYSSAGA